MSLRNKIIVIITPVMLVSVFLVNLIFGVFFNNYLEAQEDLGIESIQGSITSYINDKAARELGNVNDWAHWDDTYDFLNGNNPDYIEVNLSEDTFENLDISFMLLTKNDGTVVYRQYYDFENEEFADFAPGFFGGFDKELESINTHGDISAVYDINGDFYSIAASDVTDSLDIKPPAGRMIAGRLIDEGIKSALETLAAGELVSISAVDADGQDTGKRISQDSQSMSFDCLLPGVSSESTSVMVTFEKQRDMYIGGTREFYNFVILSVIFLCVVAIVLFVLLSIYISRPFTRLIKGVRSIDLKAFSRIDEGGKGEFLYLSRTINGMLDLIEEEESKVKENEEKLLATLTSVGDGVIVISKDNRVQFMNPVAQKLTGWTQREAIGRDFEDVFRLINEFTREKVESPTVKVFETETIVELANHTVLIAKDGTERSIEDTAAPVRNKRGNVVSCVLVFRDFSEKKEKQKRIEYLSYHDQLTGLYNRRYFEEELRRLDTGKNLPITLIYADVNGLKTINDAFGHDSGDAMIQQAAEVFKEVCAGGIISRTGGDEFIIMLTRTNSMSAEKSVLDIKEKLSKRNVMGIKVSLSFGWDTKSRSGQSVWETLKNAEDWMYRNKLNSCSGKRSDIIASILGTLHLKCPREQAHSERVSRLCEQTGKALGLPESEIRELKEAGELHDIGKIAVDGTVLNKKSSLSKSEWAQIRNHPEVGYRILSTAREFYNIAAYVLEHHERWDGGGYPKGLSGEKINIKARVIAVADSYDAMTCERPYRKALTQAEAVQEIRENSGTQFDPRIAKVFVEKVLGEKFGEGDEEEAS